MPITLAYEIADRWILGNRPGSAISKISKISRKVRVRNLAGTGCPLRNGFHPSHLCHFPGQVGRHSACDASGIDKNVVKIHQMQDLLMNVNAFPGTFA